MKATHRAGFVFAGLCLAFGLSCLDSSPTNRLDTGRDPGGYLFLFRLLDNLVSLSGPETIGISFRQLSAVAPGVFSSGQASVVYGDRVFLIGAGGGNRAYSSTDGVVWTLLGENLFPANGRFFSSALAFNGRIYLLGGYDASGPGGSLSVVPANQSVWHSVDGASWTNAAPGCLNCPGAGLGFVFQSQLRFLDSDGATIFSSPDGVTWTATPTNVSMAPRLVLIFLGEVYAFENSGAAWSSSDGTTWSRRSFTTGPPSLAKYFAHGTVFDNRMWLFPEYDVASGLHTILPPPALYSNSSLNWSMATLGCCRRWLIGSGYAVEVVGDRIWLLGWRIGANGQIETGVSVSLGGGVGVSGSGRTDFSL